jgi:hypothetical protein
MTVNPLTAIVAAIGLWAATPAAAAAAPTPRSFTGVASGGVTQTRHYVSNDGHVVADDTSEYRGRFTFTYRVLKSGAIKGSGTGRYLAVKWDETGTVNGSSFTCEAPKTAQPFRVVVGGRVSSGIVHLSLTLPSATEVLAANVQCGYGHYLVAGTTTYLRDSLAAIGGADMRFRLKRRAVLQRTKTADFTQEAAPPTLPGTFHVTQHHNWTIEVNTK